MYLIREGLQKLVKCYEDPQVNFVFVSMIEENTPCEVYVDNLEKPSISLTWDKGHCVYFGGVSSDETQYYKAMNFFREKILSEETKNKLGIIKIYFSSGEWKEALLQSLQDFRPMIFERTLYKHNHKNIPSYRIENVEVKEINSQIINNRELKNINFMLEEITGMWGSVQQFLDKGFGSCAIQGNEIVCWCTAEYVSKGICGIGIETVKDYQGKGIATTTVLKFLDRCAELEILTYWDSWKNNIQSIRVAEKAGFKKVLDYQIVFLDFFRR